MTRSLPPPVIDCARVLAYAFVDDIECINRELLLVDGNPLEAVPNLAICANLADENELLLFYCDWDWNSLCAIGGPSIEQLKAHAERNYPGIQTRWIDLNASTEEALAYYDAQPETDRCSFCGKRGFELEQWIQRPSATICKECISEFHDLLFKT